MVNICYVDKNNTQPITLQTCYRRHNTQPITLGECRQAAQYTTHHAWRVLTGGTIHNPSRSERVNRRNTAQPITLEECKYYPVVQTKGSSLSGIGSMLFRVSRVSKRLLRLVWQVARL